MFSCASVLNLEAVKDVLPGEDGSFSKRFGMLGSRLSWVTAPARGGQSFCTQKAAAELQGDKIGVKKDLRGADISHLPPNFPCSLLLSGWPHFEPHLCLLTHFAYGLQHPKLEEKKMPHAPPEEHRKGDAEGWRLSTGKQEENKVLTEASGSCSLSRS